jgi:protease I
MPKILMPVGDAAEVNDTYYAYFRLPEDGFEVVVAGPEARWYHMVLHEPPPKSEPPWDITEERPGYHIEATIAFRDVRENDYAGLFITGGRAPEYIRCDADLLRITRKFLASGKPVASVCTGMQLLTAAGIQGRRITGPPKFASDIENAGATFVDKPVVVDGNLVTGRTWHANTGLLQEFLCLLKPRNQ